MLSRITPLLFVFISLFCCSCEEAETDFSQKLLGKWEYSIIDLKINEGKEGSKHTLLNDEKSWFEGVRMKPMQAVFAKDGFFKINYIDAKGNFQYAITGDWTMENDRLSLKQDAPFEATFNYTVENNGKKGLKFSGMIDFDNDKEEDDNMTIFLNPL